MASSFAWYAVFCVLFYISVYLPALGFEECYKKDNKTKGLLKLSCATSCCSNNEYVKYCCGVPDSSDNETGIVDPAMSGATIGTVIGGVIVFLAMVGAIVACCFCKPNLNPMPDGKVAPSFYRRSTRLIHHNENTNQGYSIDVLNPAYVSSFDNNNDVTRNGRKSRHTRSHGLQEWTV